MPNSFCFFFSHSYRHSLNVKRSIRRHISNYVSYSQEIDIEECLDEKEIDAKRSIKKESRYFIIGKF